MRASGTDVSHIKATDVTDLTTLCRNMLVRILPLSTDILAIRELFCVATFCECEGELEHHTSFLF
jgi:hypothetical protein